MIFVGYFCTRIEGIRAQKIAKENTSDEMDPDVFILGGPMKSIDKTK